MKDSQNISMSFLAFAAMLLRSPFFWDDTVPHPGRMETSALRYLTIVEDEKGKEAAAKSLVILLVSLRALVWA